jgi:transposase
MMPAIPLRHQNGATRLPWPAAESIYNNRNQVERLCSRLEEWRVVATRHEKSATSCLGVLRLAAMLDWLER